MKQLLSILLAFAMGATPIAHTDSSAVTAENTKAAYVQAAETPETTGITVALDEKLDNLMRENEAALRAYLEENGHFAASLYYYVKVTDRGDWDIKVTDEWAFEDGVTYTYRGKVLRMDDPGNIHFGYLGAMLFTEEFICFGAGMNNFLKFGTVDGDLSSYYDDPQDQEMMRWGIQMYRDRTLYGE